MDRRQRRSEEARQRRGHSHARSTWGRQFSYFPDAQNPPGPEEMRAMEDVTDIRHRFVSECEPLIRTMAKEAEERLGRCLILAWIDHPDFTARHFGIKEAGDNYIAYQQSMGGHAIAWQICRREDADAVMSLTSSKQWKDFKPLAAALIDHIYPVVVAKGKDGVGLGYTYLTVPKAGLLADLPPETRFDEIVG